MAPGMCGDGRYPSGAHVSAAEGQGDVLEMSCLTIGSPCRHSWAWLTYPNESAPPATIAPQRTPDMADGDGQCHREQWRSWKAFAYSSDTYRRFRSCFAASIRRTFSSYDSATSCCSRGGYERRPYTG